MPTNVVQWITFALGVVTIVGFGAAAVIMAYGCLMLLKRKNRQRTRLRRWPAGSPLI